MLVAHMTALVMLVMMLISVIVVLVMVLMLILWHLHTISLVVLSSIHHDVLALLSIVVVHVEGIVRRRAVHRGSRGRRRVVSKWSSAAGGRGSAVDVSMIVVLVVLWIIELPRPRLVESVRTTICHLVWPRRTAKMYGPPRMLVVLVEGGF
jgi:hypothetical protein